MSLLQFVTGILLVSAKQGNFQQYEIRLGATEAFKWKEMKEKGESQREPESRQKKQRMMSNEG